MDTNRRNPLDDKTSSAYSYLEGQGEASRCCASSYPEEIWVDLVMGSLPEAEAGRLTAHSRECSYCRDQERYWRSMLDDEVNREEGCETLSDSGDALVSPSGRAGHSADPDRTPMPSRRVYLRLKSRVRLLGFINYARSLRSRLTGGHSAGIWLATSCCLLLVFGLLLTQYTRSEQDTWGQYIRDYEPSAATLISNPDSIAYPIQIGQSSTEFGMLWYNQGSEELLMLVDGLVPDVNRSVRVWAVRDDARDSLGLLQYNQLRAHLYVKNRAELRTADMLELTIEPTGTIHPDETAPVIQFKLNP